MIKAHNLLLSGQIGSVLDFNSEELAKQLAMMEQTMYNKLTPLNLLTNIKCPSAAVSAIAKNSNKVILPVTLLHFNCCCG